MFKSSPRLVSVPEPLAANLGSVKVSALWTRCPRYSCQERTTSGGGTDTNESCCPPAFQGGTARAEQSPSHSITALWLTRATFIPDSEILLVEPAVD